MNKFSPGPLTIHGPSPGGTAADDGGDYAIRDAAGHIIGEAICYTDRSYIPRPAKENAQLWAASPGLLEALKGLADYGGGEYCFCQDEDTPGQAHSERCVTARHAIDATRS